MVNRCVVCNEPVPEGLQVCSRCIKEAGAEEAEIEAAEQLRDIESILKLSAVEDGNVKEGIQGILNIAARLERNGVKCINPK